MTNQQENITGAPLVLIDLQQAIDHPDWGIRNNPNAEQKLSKVLAFWRSKSWPVIHVKHNSKARPHIIYPIRTEICLSRA